MWHKAIWKGHPMRLELTRVGLLVKLANHYTTRGALLSYPMNFVWFGYINGISTIVGYSMPNPLYTYISNIYDLALLGFMAYQPL